MQHKFSKKSFESQHRLPTNHVQPNMVSVILPAACNVCAEWHQKSLAELVAFVDKRLTIHMSIDSVIARKVLRQCDAGMNDILGYSSAIDLKELVRWHGSSVVHDIKQICQVTYTGLMPARRDEVMLSATERVVVIDCSHHPVKGYLGSSMELSAIGYLSNSLNTYSYSSWDSVLANSACKTYFDSTVTRLLSRMFN